MLIENNNEIKARILVVDDDLITAHGIKILLEKYNYKVIGVAGSESEAVELMKCEKPDLVIMDINLGEGLSGIEVSRKLKNIIDAAIIFVTAYSDEDTIQKAKAASPAGYIIKPFSNRELYTAVEMAIYKHSAERRLKESEEKFKMLFNQAPLGYQSLDENGCFLAVNQAWLDTLGYSSEEVVGKWFGDFLAPAFKDAFRQRFPMFKAAGKIHSEFEMVHKNGSIHYIAFEGRVGYNFDGTFKQTHCILADITEQRNAGLAIIESEKRFRDLFDYTPIAYQSLDENGLFIDVNEDWLQMMGYSRGDVIGKSFEEFWSPETRKFFKEKFEIFKCRERLTNAELVLIKKSGELITVLLTSKIQHSDVEGGLKSHCIIIDITQRKDIEDKLRLEEEKYRSIFENVQDVYYEALMDGTIMEVSPSIEIISKGQYRREDLIGKSMYEFYIDPKERDNLLAQLNEKGKLIDYEVKVKNLDGSIIDCSVSSKIHKDIFTGKTKIIGSMHDITERKAAENSIKQKNSILTTITEFAKELTAKPAGEINAFIVHKLKEYTNAIDVVISEYDNENSELVVAESTLDRNGGSIFARIIGKKILGFRIPVNEIMRAEIASNNIARSQSLYEISSGSTPKLISDALQKAFGIAWLTGIALMKDQQLVGTMLIVGKSETILPDNEFLTTFAGVAANAIERKKAEEQLTEREELFKAFVENSDDITTLTDENDNILFISPQSEKLLGFDGAKYIGQKMPFNIHPDDIAGTQKAWMNIKTKKVEIRNFEYRIIDNNNNIRWVSHTAKHVQAEGKELGIQSTIREITDRKIAEETLRLNEEKYRTIFNSSPIAIEYYDGEGNILDANKASIEMFGYSNLDNISGFNLFNSPQIDNDIRTKCRKGIPVRYEKKISFSDVKKDNLYKTSKTGEIFLDTTIIPINLKEDNTPTAFVVQIQDITDRKIAEQQILDSQILLRSSVESPKDMIILSIDRNYNYLYLNTFHKEVMYIAYGKLVEVGMNILDCITDEEDRKKSKINYDRALTGESHVCIEELGDLERYFYETRYSPILNDEGKVVGATAFASNITDRIKAEEKLRKSEYDLLEAQRLAHIGSWTYDPFTQQPEWSEEMFRIWGLDSKFGAPHYSEHQKLIHPDDFKRFDNAVKEAVEEGKPYELELRLCVPDGTIKTIVTSCLPEKDNAGRIIGLHGTCQDITERKYAEELLKEREALLIDTGRIAKIGGWEVDAKTSKVSWTYEVYKTHEIEPGAEISLEMGIGFYKGLSKDIIQKAVKDAIDLGKAFDLELEIITAKGNQKWVRTIGKPIEENGRIVKVRGSFQDITERKQAEIYLKQSEERYKNFIMQVTEGVYRLELDEPMPDNLKVEEQVDFFYDHLYLAECNLAFMKMYDVTESKDLIGKSQLELHGGRNNQKNRQAFRDFILAGYRTENALTEEIGSGGNTKYFSNNAVGIFEDGHLVRFWGTQADITERIKSEKALKESEERYRKFFEADLEGVYKVDSNGNLLDCNEAFLKIYEYDSKEQALAASMFELYPVKNTRLNIYKRLKAEKKIDLIESKLRTIKGREIYIIESMIAEYNEKGKFSAATGFVIDVTDIKIAEQAVKESENKYRELFNRMENGFAYHEIILNKKGKPVDYRFLVVNSAFEKMTGLKSDEIMGKRVLEILPNTEEYWINAYGKVALTRKPVKLENYSQVTGRHYRVLAYSPEKMRFACLIEDVTESKKTEEKIRQLSLAVEQSPVSVGITDLDGNLIYVNPQFAKSTGYAVNELIGQNPRILKSGYTKKDEYAKMWKTISTGKTWSGILQNKKKDGGLYWESANISPLRDTAGKITHYIGIKEDITEKVAAERELEIYRNHLEGLVEMRTNELDEANKHLQEEIRKEKEYELILKDALSKEQELSELKTRFISTASHEFRTPLTAILLSTGLVQRYGKKWPKDKLELHIDRIKSSIQYLTNLLDDVLTINKTDSGKIFFDPKPVDLLDFCNEVIQEIKGYIKDNHQFSFNYEPSQKQYLLDIKLLRFMLSNLLSNAFKYSPNGGKVLFTVSSTKNDIIFRISDQGIGIPEKDRQFLYEPFHRSSNCMEIQGTGLGLSIVKRAVGLHKGEIIYLSELNVGTTFVINLPINDLKEKNRPDEKTGLKLAIN